MGANSLDGPHRGWKPVASSVSRPRMSLVLQSLLPYPDSCQGTSPYQQGWDTKMANLSHGGIDVASDRLDVMLLPEEQRFWVSNNAAGWAELVARLGGLCIEAIGIEASGGYERGVIRALLAAGISVRQINPFKLRQFAKASGVLAKNDRLDARMIALFVATIPTRPAQRNEAAERMAEIVSARRQLSDEKVAADNASRLFEDTTLRRLYRRRLMRLELDIALLDKRLAEMVAANAAFSGPDLDAGCRSGPRVHAHRLAAGARPNEPQAGRRNRRSRALRLRQWQTQRNALHLGRPRTCPASALHGGLDCLSL